ncbi:MULTISPECIES: hypothetical protein [Bacillus]|uniref:hypothetical protein n=1 Tax=Bacillus TaxID=1386 RepID=UPI0002DBF0CF|nr:MULTISPECIES: hypothetical protein [Bacillus]
MGILKGNEQVLLDLICEKGGGVDIQDAINSSGMSYKEVIYTSQQLIGKGYQLRGISVGGSIKRLLLSPYDTQYENLIKK